jgi:hypothetical protein
MKYNFCTLFDKNFLTRGVALHRSLMDQRQEFMLWILCMDDESYVMMQKLDLPNVRLLRLSEVEDERLLSVKNTRTPVEYCWMFSSALPLYILEKNPGLGMAIYLDADIYFYSPLDAVFEEFAGSSIGIIPHGFSPANSYREKTSGIYNVAMMIFRSDDNGFAALRWWKDRVIEWCFNRYEDGKLGDQLYLNDWPTRFSGVCVLKNPGIDVASWNVGRFRFNQDGGGFSGREKATGRKFRLIFYHFHGLKIYSDRRGRILPYPSTIHDRKIYRHYMRSLQKAYDQVRAIDRKWDYGCGKKLDILRVIKQYITLWVSKKS